jgi:hypothetical protein
MRQSRTTACLAPSMPELFDKGQTDSEAISDLWLRLFISFKGLNYSLA